MIEDVSPYKCHIFVCTNARQGERKSCADGKSKELAIALKKKIKEQSWSNEVRVSRSSCMGLCEKGPNVVLYPQRILFSNVKHDDTEKIYSKICEIIETFD